MGEIRTCTREDIPAIAAMFQRAFRNPRKPAAESLQDCLSEVFFRHPWYDPEVASRVSVSDHGIVNGFIGVVPLRMSFRGQPIRAAVPSSLVVAEPEKDPFAGAKLLRSFLSGPQDVSISETANPVSQRMWMRLGGVSARTESMEWLRVFQPAGLALSQIHDRFPPIKVFAPVASLVDRAVTNKSAGMFHFDVKNSGPDHDADVSDDELFKYLVDLGATYSLRPEWDPGCVKFMLSHAGQNAGRGTLFRRIVYGKREAPLGCYLYHGRPGAIAWVLQILAPPSSAGAVVDSLFRHAFLHGSVAVKGSTPLRFLNVLAERRCFFFLRHPTLVHSRSPELISAVCSGDAMTSGLAAETWMRLIGDKFK